MAIIIPKMTCPYCGGRLSEVRTDMKKYWQHCYSCHFEFTPEKIEEGENNDGNLADLRFPFRP